MNFQEYLNLNQKNQAERYLSDPYYESVAKRIQEGSLTFDIGESTWNPEWYTDPHGNVNFPICFQMAYQFPEINHFAFYYAKEIDFHHIRFHYQNEDYLIEWYKVYRLYRKSDNKSRYYFYKHWLIDDFHLLHTRTWEDARYDNPFNSPSFNSKALCKPSEG